ncbi:MAG: branched-chain amino acid transport system substrate-binding protein, partial [Chloroflexia bacterium]|nr:branched-chain amino acid transport system substrate-binding protein [Chloroflexia bacterium]
MKGKQSVQADASGYNRREFIVNASKIAGALIALPLLSKAQGAAAKTSPVGGAVTTGSSKSTARRTIGVLLPQSSVYPQMGANFLAGMNLYFSQAGLQNMKIVTAEVGACCGKAQVQAEAMLRAQKLDLMLGMVNPGVASSLRSVLEANKTAFVATGLGENLARTGETSPYIFHHTLGMWEANYALGKWAATTLGRTAIMASSFYDSGYDTLYAFQMGFEAGGGRVLATHVTHQPAADNGLATLTSAIRQSKPAVVFASYYGQSAVDLLNAYARAGLSRSVPLVGTAFLVDQAVVNSVGSAAA